MMASVLTKKDLRTEMSQVKRLLSAAEREAAAEGLTSRLVSDARLAAVRNVVAYMPMPDEIDVRPSLAAFLARGQKVFLPVIVGDDLIFRQYTGPECLAPEGRYGILEPQGTPELDVASCASSDVAIVVPGVAFASDGRRLGRGRGFYDRTLRSLPPDAYTVGVCFLCQLLPDVPTEPHDVRMRAVIAI